MVINGPPRLTRTHRRCSFLSRKKLLIVNTAHVARSRHCLSLCMHDCHAYYNNYITASNNTFRASDNHIFSSGQVLFRDSLSIRPLRIPYLVEAYFPGGNFYAQCDADTEIQVSGGCESTTAFLRLYQNRPDYNNKRHVCNYRNEDENSRRVYVHALCLKVR